MRAMFSFGLAGVLAAAGLFYPPTMFFAFPVAGLAAALLMRRRTVSNRRQVSAVVMATGGGFLTGFIVIFGMISLQAAIDPMWGAISWGLGFGLGGAAAGPALSWLWIPPDSKSARVRTPGLIAWLAFTFSGAIAGYVAFLGFATLRVTSLALCVWLAYLLGGVLCDVGWSRTLTQSGSWPKDQDGDASRPGDDRATRPDGEAVVLASDPERQAQRSMVWGIAAIFLLIFMVARTRWPLALVDVIIMTVLSTPLAMLRIREVSHQAVLLLLILGAPALWWGASVLRSSRREPGLLTDRGRRRAILGTGLGASLVIGGMFLLFPPMTRVFDSLYGRVLLASAQSADQWDAGNRIHQANIMMGRAALRGGNIEEAKAHLLAAGRTSGSPQLNSFGPDMSLAGEMLETGQRETVLEYLGLCRSLWKLGGGSLDAWTLDIQEGRTPNFGWSPGRTVATVTDTLPDPNAQVLQVATVRDDATRKEIRIVAAVDTRPDGQGRLKSHATHLKFDADLPLKDDRFRGSGRPRLPTMANRWLGINEHRLKVDTIPLGNVTGSAKTMEFRLAGDGQENFGFVRLSYLSGEMSGPSTVSISALAQAEGKEFQDGQSGIRVVIAAENLAKISAHWWAPGSRPVLADLENFTRSARGTNPTTSPPTTKTGPGP